MCIRDRNKITSNLTVREDSIELINDIYDAPLATDVLNTSLFTPALMRFGGSSNTDSTQYVGVASRLFKKFDTGDDVGWLTIDSSTDGAISTVTYTIDANNTGLKRTVGIEAIDGVNDPIFYIVQDGGFITVDNNTITVDNNIITVDNG